MMSIVGDVNNQTDSMKCKEQINGNFEMNDNSRQLPMQISGRANKMPCLFGD